MNETGEQCDTSVSASSVVLVVKVMKQKVFVKRRSS
jgi:hypothetical protein